MSDAISSIGSWLSGTAGQGLLKAGTVGGGFLQNILANRQAQQRQNFVQNLITNPTKWSQFVSNFNQPLAAGLTSDVARETDAYGAERGLGSSPAVMQDVYAQALAPFIQQQQATAGNEALQALGIYSGQPTTKPVDITSLLKLFTSPSAPTVAGQSPISVPGGSTTASGGYGGWVGPIQDAPSGDSGIGSIPGGQQSPFDYASLVSNLGTS
jgi:hypothetical protein